MIKKLTATSSFMSRRDSEQEEPAGLAFPPHLLTCARHFWRILFEEVQRVVRELIGQNFLLYAGKLREVGSLSRLFQVWAGLPGLIQSAAYPIFVGERRRGRD